MQTAGYSQSRTTGKAHHKRVRVDRELGNDPQKANHSSSFGGNDFLKTLLKPIATPVMTGYVDRAPVNLLTEENYRYLLDSANNYARLLGKKLRHRSGGSLNESILNLFEEFEKLLGDVNVNIESKDGRLIFTLYKYHEWESYLFYWLPVVFVDRLKGTLKKIAITFLSELAESNRISPIYNEDDFQYMLENLETSVDMGECDREDEKMYRKLIVDYQEGAIKKKLERAHRKRYYKNLSRAIERYQPQNDYEKTLISLFEQGLEFIGNDKPRIMDYNYDPDFDPYDDYRPVDLCRIIRYVYDYGEISDQLEGWTNCELNETYALSPVTIYNLTPGTTERFSMDDYPERFCKWFMELSKTVNV